MRYATPSKALMHAGTRNANSPSLAAGRRLAQQSGASVCTTKRGVGLHNERRCGCVLGSAVS